MQTYLLDAKGLDVLNRIFKGSRDSAGAVDFRVPYNALYQLFYDGLRNRVEPHSAYDRLARGYTEDQIEDLRYGDMNSRPPLVFESPSVVEDALAAFKVYMHIDVLGKVIGNWWQSHMDSLSIGCAPLGTSEAHGTYVNTVEVMDRTYLREQEKYVRLIQEGLFGNPRFRFTPLRRSTPFMLFPGDAPGYAPELDLATEALYALSKPRIDTDFRLMIAVSQYLARTTLCTEGTIASGVRLRTPGQKSQAPIPGEAGGNQWNNVITISYLYETQAPRLYGRLRMSEDEMDLAPGIDRLPRDQIEFTYPPPMPDDDDDDDDDYDDNDREAAEAF